MTTEASNWWVQQYNDGVIHVYQQEGHKLRPCVTPASRIEGEKATFWIAGRGKAVKKQRGQRNMPMNAERKKVEATLETWKAYDTVDEYDLERMNTDEMRVVQESGANALGVATDMELFAKLAAAAPASGARFIDFSAGDFGAENAKAAIAVLRASIKKWDGMVYCPMPSLPFEQLTSYRVVNSADHVGKDIPYPKATTTRFWNGVNWFAMDENDAQDYYPIPESNKADIFMWHKSAVAWANNTDLKTRVAWHNDLDHWSVNMECSGAAVVLQPEGVVRMRISTNSAIGNN